MKKTICNTNGPVLSAALINLFFLAAWGQWYKLKTQHGYIFTLKLVWWKHFPIYTSSRYAADYHSFGVQLINASLAYFDSLLFGVQQVGNSRIWGFFYRIGILCVFIPKGDTFYITHSYIFIIQTLITLALEDALHTEHNDFRSLMQRTTPYVRYMLISYF